MKLYYKKTDGGAEYYCLSDIGDGEGVWHCDVELTNDLDNSYYDTAESMWSFDEV